MTKLTTQQPAFARGLSIVSKAVGRSTSLPVLANILIGAFAGEGARLTATDLTASITVDLEAACDSDFGITLPAKTLVDLVATLPDGELTLTLNDRTHAATINSGRTKASVKGIAADEFPTIHRLNADKAVSLSGPVLRGMLRGVLFAAAKPDSGRPVLETVLLTIEGDRLALAASDGFRVAEIARTLPSKYESVSVLLPAKSARDLAGLIDGADEVLMQEHDGRAIFRAGNVEIAMQTVEGTFPKYHGIVPKSYATRAVVDTESARKACKSVDIIAREQAHRMSVVIAPGDELTPGSVSLFGEAAQTGDNRAEMDATIEGGEVKFAVNAQYMADPLAAYDAEQVAVEVTKPTAPIMLRPVGDDGAWCVVMPLALA